MRFLRLVLALWLLAAAPAQARDLALLIGVGGYDEPAIRALEGPRNDVALLWRLLVKQGVAARDVTVLADGLPETPDGPRASAAPTRAAILDAFAALAATAGEGDRVIVHYSGHGATQPEGAVEEGAEPEPGGRVQVLLPKDAGRYDEATRTIRNALVDKEIGRALDRIRATGARLFVVIDACHAGTVTRAGAGVPRSVAGPALGVPEAAPAPPSAPARRASVKLDARKGAMVGFFAVDSWSEALERPLPSGEGGTKPYGLFTWHLARALEQGRARSYRELARLVAADLAAAPGAPAPMFEGDLDAPLPGARLGATRFPARVGEGALRVEAGQMQGVEAGARLAVFDGPAADARPLGIASVEEAGPAQSRAAFAGPDRAVYVEIESPGASFRLGVAAPGAAALVEAAARGLPVDLVDGPADLVVSREGDSLRLVPNEGGGLSLAADDPAQLRAALWRFARAANLARLAAASASGGEGAGLAATLEVVAETDPARLADPRPACAAPSRPATRMVGEENLAALGHCDAIKLSLDNRGERDLDVAVFLVDPAGEIAMPSRDWRSNGCMAYLPAKAGRPLVVRTQARLWTAQGPGLAGPHRVLVFALERKGGMAPDLCALLAPAPPEPGQAVRAGGRAGFARLLTRAGLADPGLRAANPFAEEEEGGGGFAARRFLLDLRASGP